MTLSVLRIKCFVFFVDLNGKKVPVELKWEGLPNDMKMLAFFAGKLTNSAKYFVKRVPVEFKLEGLTNDMKMLANFLQAFK